MIERLPDPVAHPELWNADPEKPRFDFETSQLMHSAGIPADMSEAANERYLSLLEELQVELGDEVRIRATPYRTGPAAAGDYAWFELVFLIGNLTQMGVLILAAANWLHGRGALEIRASEGAIETLARWELEKRGHPSDSPLIALTLTPGEGITHVGVPRAHGGYVVVFRLPDNRLVTMTYSLGGILQAHVEERART